ncbi:hypothetical protein BB559_005756 [Furculomyces boomerangus]|uniref:Ribosome biogenesis protein NOP53 n=1 Tax=Furculomyces boomerangus TaxID=61424 RepID=A0A2T9Y6S4_9FUNG|nr:hypothetical protein BB559_005756 [Furculomyces boomerangus]
MSVNIQNKVSKKKGKASRRSKQSWRKNIDLSVVETGLDEIRQEKIQSGVIIQDQDNSELFSVDTKPSDKQYLPKTRKLKIYEILESASKIIVPGKQLNTKNQKSIKDRHNSQLKASLKKLAGRGLGMRGNGPKLEIEKTVDFYDIWDGKDKSSANEKIEKFFSIDKALLKPSADKPRISLSALQIKERIASAVEIPDPGASYQPLEKDRMNLVNKVAKKILDEQNKEEKIAEKIKGFRGNNVTSVFNERAEAVLSDIQKNTEQDPESETVENTTLESNEIAIDMDSLDDSDSNDDDVSDTDTVVNMKPGSKNTRKTRVQRNKEEKNRKKIMSKVGHKIQKAKFSRINKINKIKADLEKNMAVKKAEKEVRDNILREKALIPKKKIGKYKVKEFDESVKLSDEISGSLRALKPESNLVLESFVGLQRRNLIEPRIPVEKRRRYKTKTTEKWSYKDFK